MKNLLRRLTATGRRKILLAIIIITALGFGLWRRSQTSSAPEFITDTATRGTIVSTVSASGSVLTSNISNIISDAQGVVKSVYVKDGDIVYNGQTIAEIELDQAGQQAATAAYASYLSAKNAADTSQTSYYTLQSDLFTKWKEFKELADSDTYTKPDGTPDSEQRSLPEFMIPQNDWLAAEAKYKQQQSVISQTRTAQSNAWLSYRKVSGTITAPMSGTINNITIVPGMTLTKSGSVTDTVSSERVAVITSPGRPLVEVTVTEVDVPNIKVGQKTTITVDSIIGKSYTGIVESVDKLGSVSSNVTSYPIIIRLDTEASELLPNMTATANIILDTKTDVITVPSAAVQTIGDASYVRVLINGEEMQTPVEIGIVSDSQTEIVSGISEGDTVITGSQTSTTGQSAFSSGGFFGTGAMRSGGSVMIQRR